MALENLWQRLEQLPLAIHIGQTWWFPLLESLHVLAATLVFGAILTVDLRLLGLAGRRYRVSRIVGELVPWSIGAFVVAVTTGVGLFITRADGYLDNTAFQIKLVLLLLAGINIAIFHLRTLRTVAGWDQDRSVPLPAKLAGAASLALWVGVMFAGRWVGHLL
jgi:hypothetical protein